MEALTQALSICAVTVALYQMSGTPFFLNIAIFCFCTLLCLYAMLISGFFIPSEPLYEWFFESPEKCKKSHDSSAGENDWDLEDTDDQITKKLRELTGHIVRDFILSWYNTVSDDVTFVQEAFELFEYLLKASRSRVSAIDREKLLKKILEKVLEHHETYQRISNSIQEKMSPTMLDEEDIKRKEQLLVVSYSEKCGHPALANLPDSENEHLRGLVLLLLKALLPTEYKLTQTPLFIVRELIAQNVLNSLVNLMSDPLWIYQTVHNVLTDRTTTGTRENDDKESTDKEDDEIESDYAEASTLPDNTSYHKINHHSVSSEDAQNNLCQSLSSDQHLPEMTEDEMDRSHTTTASFSSQVSVDSLEMPLISSSMDDDMPLPMTSSLMHFAPESNVPLNSSDVSTSSESSTAVVSRSPNAPPDRLFFRIRIPESVTMQENYDGGGKYTLYQITYKTIEQNQGSPLPDAQPATDGNEGGSAAPHPSSEVVNQNPYKFVRHKVQRRFREFLALQERLSQNMVAKNLIGDIKGPSRMFPVPFGNMDKEYIEQRRKFLQAYLRELCSISYISNCREVREFLAYESDPRIAFVKKPDALPRLDKLLKSAIQDLFGSTTMKFSSTLHLDEEDAMDNEQMRILRQRHQRNLSGDENAMKFGPVAKLKSLLGSSPKLITLEDSNPERTFSDFEMTRFTTPSNWLEPTLVKRLPSSPDQLEMRFFPRSSGDGCDSAPPDVENEKTKKINHDNNSCLPDIVFKLMYHIWHLKPGTHNLLVLSLNNFVDRYLTKKINQLTTKESWTRYLKILRDSLWPNGKWGSDKGEEMNWITASENVKVKAKERAQEALEAALPNVLKRLVGENEYLKGIKELVDSFENTGINRHLVYFLLDLLVFELFPDIDSVIVSNNISLNAAPTT